MKNGDGVPAVLPKGFRIDPPKGLVPYRLAAVWLGWLWIPCLGMFASRYLFGVPDQLYIAFGMAGIVLSVIATIWRRRLDKSLPWIDANGERYDPHAARLILQAFNVRRTRERLNEYGTDGRTNIR